jgi:hypothetical protein
VSIPRILTEAVFLLYTSCTGEAVAEATATIGGQTYLADPPFAFAFQETGELIQFITYSYPSVTITSLSASQTLFFVTLRLYLLNIRTKWCRVLKFLQRTSIRNRLDEI